MTPDLQLVKRCPACGTESPPAALRCACGTLLASVDLTPPAGAAPVDQSDIPTVAAPDGPAPTAAAGAATTVVCAHADCAQPNPAGTVRCVYCDRPLTAKSVRVTIKWPWGERTPVPAQFLIGRSFGADPALIERLEREYDNVSRRHAMIRIAGDVVSIEDLGSSNGTFLNGIRLPANHPVRVRNGAKLRFAASLEVSVRIEE
jgi:hypothetical protein